MVRGGKLDGARSVNRSLCKTCVHPPIDFMNAITEILQSFSTEAPRNSEDLVVLLYDELRQLAASRLATEPPGQTLQATALVHEAWLRLVDTSDPPVWNSRGHFFGAAAQAMRRILVENARRKHAEKRGGGAEAIDLDSLELAAEGDDERILAVNDAIERLSVIDPEAARLVILRFFAGLTGEEAAAALGLSVRSASRLWTYARAWLHRELSA